MYWINAKCELSATMQTLISVLNSFIATINCVIVDENRFQRHQPDHNKHKSRNASSSLWKRHDNHPVPKSNHDFHFRVCIIQLFTLQIGRKLIYLDGRARTHATIDTAPLPAICPTITPRFLISCSSVLVAPDCRAVRDLPETSLFIATPSPRPTHRPRSSEHKFCMTVT